MYDRQPKYPGRIELTDVETGVKKKYDMVMADEPLQDGTPPTKVNLLSDGTAEKIGLSPSATVDDALSKLFDFATIGKTILKVMVTTGSGEPVPGVAVALDEDPIYGESAETNSSGIASLIAELGQHTVMLKYPLGFSGNESTSVNLDSEGAILDVNVTGAEDLLDDIWTIEKSGKYKVRLDVKNADIFLCGGGGGGAVYVKGTQGQSVGGGAGGFTKNVYSISLTDGILSVQIGAGGHAGQGASGGTYYPYANGGQGGKTSVTVGSTTYEAEGGGPGLSNGEGGDGGSGGGGAGSSGSSGSGGTDGSNGTANSYRGSGQGSSTRPFEDSSLDPCCAGGGGKNLVTGGGSGGTRGGGPGGFPVKTTEKSTCDATYYGSGGGGATSVVDFGYAVYAKAGAGYRGVVMVRRTKE